MDGAVITLGGTAFGAKNRMTAKKRNPRPVYSVYRTVFSVLYLLQPLEIPKKYTIEAPYCTLYRVQ
jgi:hypothetical protein